MPQITIYVTSVCPYCHMALQLLASKNIPASAIDQIVLDDQPEARAALATRTGRRTVPQIFIGEYHVGGFDDLAALNRRGELDQLLLAA